MPLGLVATVVVTARTRRCRVAGYRALAAVGSSIVDLLNRRFDELLPAAPQPPKAVLAGTVDFDQVNTSPTAVIQYPAISVYCYRVSVDRETRPGWSSVASVDGIPRLPLAHAPADRRLGHRGGERAGVGSGLTAQILESEPILTGPLLHPSGDWAPGDAIQVVSRRPRARFDERGVPGADHGLPALAAVPGPGHPHRRSKRESDGEPVATVARAGVHAMTDTSVIATSVGPADVLHRLALGVEPRDAVTGSPRGHARCASARRCRRALRPRRGAVRDLLAVPGFRNQRNRTVQAASSRSADQTASRSTPTGRRRRSPCGSTTSRRRFVPRRFRIPLWTRLELETRRPHPAAAAARSVHADGVRLLRPWLLPGSRLSDRARHHGDPRPASCHGR